MCQSTIDRSAGILLPVFSLPSQQGIGCFNEEAYRWVDYLVEWGFRYWQICPLGPTGYGDSPYQPFSAFAGNPYFIDLEDLTKRGWLKEEAWASLKALNVECVDYGSLYGCFGKILYRAYQGFLKKSTSKSRDSFERFKVKEAVWLKPYALFRVLKFQLGEKSWVNWPKAYQQFETMEAMRPPNREFEDAIQFHYFTQWVWHEQWCSLKAYANKRGIQLLGDIPLYVGLDSADVWATREIFQWNKEKNCPHGVAGVPPDYFSSNGQLWGNPLFDWDYLRDKRYDWWILRIKKNLECFDRIRLDHFRGFYDYWKIPYGAKTARNGTWIEGPQIDFFNVLRENSPSMPFVFEDLGNLHEGVCAFKRELGLPGMAILQFAFDGNSQNPYLPHNLDKNTVIYTGSHDNDTTTGWYASSPEKTRDFCRRYLSVSGNTIAWDFIRTVYASVAKLAILPFQDLLSLGSFARINLPGSAEGNWRWRCSVKDWERVHRESGAYLNQLACLYGRKVQG